VILILKCQMIKCHFPFTQIRIHIDNLGRRPARLAVKLACGSENTLVQRAGKVSPSSSSSSSNVSLAVGVSRQLNAKVKGRCSIFSTHFPTANKSQSRWVERSYHKIQAFILQCSLSFIHLYSAEELTHFSNRHPEECRLWDVAPCGSCKNRRFEGI
jgi:hypothetical protein